MASPKAAGLALGITWGVFVFLCTIISSVTGYARTAGELLMSIYPGYSITIIGSIIGLIYSFIDGFIMGFVVVWLYNRFSK